MMSDQMNIDEVEKYLRSRGRFESASSEELDEAIQELWLTVLDKPAELTSNVPWLFGVLRNLLRRRYRQRTQENTEMSPLPFGEESPSAADKVIKAELSRDVQQAIQALPEEYQEVVVLKYFCQMPPRVIAEELDCSVKTVHNRLYRANQAMREKLEGHRESLAYAPIILASVRPKQTTKLASFISSRMLLLTKYKLVTALSLALTVLVVGLILKQRTNEESDLEIRNESAALHEKHQSPVHRTAFRARSKVRESNNKNASNIPAQEPSVETSKPARNISTLQLEIRSAQDHAHLSDVSLTMANQERYVSLGHGQSPLKFPLSTGIFNLWVSSPGYNPVVVSDVVLTPGKPTDLAPVFLQPGTGSILGEVEIPDFLAGKSLSLELAGKGRIRCEACSTDSGGTARCERCGFQDDYTAHTLGENGRFQFGPLASGRYFLTIRNASRKVLKSRAIKLGAGEKLWADLKFESFDLEVNVLTRSVKKIAGMRSQGPMSFEGSWLEGADAYQENIRFYFSQHGVSRAEASYQAAGEGRPFFDLNLVAKSQSRDGVRRREPRNPRPARSTQTGRESAPLPWPSRLDYRRTSQTLRPSLIQSIPDLPHEPLEVIRLRHGVFKIIGIPAEVDEFFVACGPWMSEKIVRNQFKSRRPIDGPMNITLSYCPKSSEIQKKSFRNNHVETTCASCHKNLPRFKNRKR